MATPASSRSLPLPLEQCARSFQQAVRDVRNLTGSAAEDRLNERPGRDRWSCLECIVHLNLTNAAMLPGIEKAIENAPDSEEGRATYRMDLAGRLLAWSLEPPARIKMKTSPMAQPAEGADWHEVMARFDEQHSRLIDLLGKAAGKDISKQKIESPFANLQYNAFSAFRIIAAHDRRHIAQARGALASVMRAPALS